MNTQGSGDAHFFAIGLYESKPLLDNAFDISSTIPNISDDYNSCCQFELLCEFPSIVLTSPRKACIRIGFAIDLRQYLATTLAHHNIISTYSHVYQITDARIVQSKYPLQHKHVRRVNGGRMLLTRVFRERVNWDLSTLAIGASARLNL